MTSCNLTGEEMDADFLKGSLFKRIDVITGYKTFTFGGVKGQVVTTQVY